MPDKRYVPGCGPSCLRCWQNRMQHANPEAKRFLKKHGGEVTGLFPFHISGERPEKKKGAMRIGIDCGGVLFPTNTKFEGGGEDTTQTEEWMPGALQSLDTLRKLGHELFVVSFCGKRRALETREKLLEVKDVIPPEHVFIVKDKLKKGTVCRNEGIQVLIDDRQDVLRAAKKNFPELTCILFESWEQVMDSIQNVSH